MTSANTSDRGEHRIDKPVFLLVALGALLRMAQYLACTTLWGDELMILRNVMSRGPVKLLTRPLSDFQVAPSGFLLVLKLVVTTLGASEYSLRLFPLLSSLLALPFFALLARRFLPRPALLLALAAFSTSIPVIHYAAQAKPYSSDVAASLLCLVVAQSWTETRCPRASLWAAAAGAIAIWLSYAAVFTLGAVAVVVLVRATVRSRMGSVRQLAVALGAWLLSGTGLAIVEYHRMSDQTSSILQKYWADWMMPAELNLPQLFAWLIRLARDFFSDFLHLPLWPALCLLLLVGIGYSYKRTPNTMLLVVPGLTAFAAAGLRHYPFRGRLILFLVPNALLLISAGVFALASAAAKVRLLRWGQPVMLLGAAAALAVRPLWLSPPPYRDSETEPILRYLGLHYIKGDAVYVHPNAWFPFEFYGPRLSLPVKEASVSSILIKGELGQLRTGPHPIEILRDLDAFRGRSRLWVVFAQADVVESKAVVCYLDSIGHRLDCRSSYGSAIYLYDLSDSHRLGFAKPEEFSDKAPAASACK